MHLAWLSLLWMASVNLNYKNTPKFATSFPFAFSLFLPKPLLVKTPNMSRRFTRNGYNTRIALYNLWKRHTITGPMEGSIIRNQHFQQHCKAYSRPTQSIYRKAKDVDLSASANVASSALPSSGSWASKFGLVEWYLGMIKSRPVVTKSITSALIYTAADLTSQTISRPSGESYDLVRTSRMAGYGLLILGPSLHYWFNFVSKALPKRDLVSTLKKMALGQTVYGPCMTVVFFSVNAALQGESSQEIVGRLKRDLVPTMISGVMYWPLCDFLTFKFVPVHLQPLVSNSFSYLWTVYMTYMASREKVGTA